MIFKLTVVLALMAVTISAKRLGDYITLQEPCDPAVQNGGIATKENEGKVCFSGTTCNPVTKICDCSDSSDGRWRRTYQDGECRLLPTSRCVKVDQDYYRCVKGAECTQIRKGTDDPRKCPADAPCDTGDFACICPEGQTCLDKKIEAPKVPPTN